MPDSEFEFRPQNIPDIWVVNFTDADGEWSSIHIRAEDSANALKKFERIREHVVLGWSAAKSIRQETAY
jgi:hypothetical protein